MSQRAVIRVVFFAFALLVLAGCSSSSVKEDLPQQAINDRQAVNQWKQLDQGVEVSTLNDLMTSAELDALIAEAVKANPSLQQTMMSLKVLQAQYRQTRSDQFVDIDASLEGERQEGSEDSYTSSVSISWELDVWAKLNDESSAANQDVAEQLALYQSAKDTLVSEVMEGWLYLIYLSHSMDIERQRIEVLGQNETFITQRYRAGLGTLEDIHSARSTLASSQADLISAKQALAEQQRALNVLLGRTDGQTRIPDEYPSVQLPLAELPDQTLQRRPDLKAAWYAIDAEKYRTRAAYKAMLPSISLSASLSDSGDSPVESLLKDPLWNLLGQLSAPLFRSGELKAAAEAAEYTQAQAYHAYRETLLEAVQEVQDAIGQEKSLARQQERIDVALKSAELNLEQYQQKYRSGLVSLLDLLDVQEQTFDLKSQRDQLIYQRLSNRISLGLALGLGTKDVSDD
jgi:NodT family efflux transporter outer membrane factor (OMF) lipoprotein